MFTAKPIEVDGKQVVLLPRGFELPGTEVRFTVLGNAILIDPIDAPAAVDDFISWT